MDLGLGEHDVAEDAGGEEGGPEEGQVLDGDHFEAIGQRGDNVRNPERQ